MLENKDQAKTSLSQLGEFGLIDHLTKHFTINQESTLKSIGDDAAVLDFGTKKAVVSTDLLVEGVHFDLAYMPLRHLGYKAVVANLSDICAMNAKPTQITVSIAVSNRFPLEALEELFDGITMASKVYNVDVIGGDTTSSQKGLIISITAIGEANLDDIVYRNGAQVSDLLVVSGDIGAAYMGLQVLEREERKDLKELFEKLEFKPTSMIDVSDGLSSEIMHLCKQSNVGCNIYEEKIPVDPQLINVCEEFNLDITTIALSGGEDYELLFTIKMEDYDKIKGNPNFTVIGHMTQASEGMHLVTRANTKIELKARGWNALSE